MTETDPLVLQNDFLAQLTKVIEKHISDEHFGVSELASAMNMSRSNLLRKVRKLADLSASQFIRQVRLKKGMELLTKTSHTVSEISFQVGFGSPSYFIKCFREHYGYPPGEVGHRKTKEIITNAETTKELPSKSFSKSLIFLVPGVLVFITGFLIFKNAYSNPTESIEKSIAVLPFKNESADSTNLYFVNGLMESTLSNLQKIEDLRVISRTSVEKYRNTNKSIPEIAEELHVNYFVEGSGQKVGDQILLYIQLIDASTDKHIWAEQYSRQVGDIFALQNEVAQKITSAIEVIVTPTALEQIEKVPTDNLQAYDFFLQALDPFFSRTKPNLQKAISLFEKAIDLDPQFAKAYANIAISYYFLDQFQKEKQYTEKINNYADKALLFDPKLAESLIAKAFYYITSNQYSLARPHLEKALEYNPNAPSVIHTLADYYARLDPNSEKYLEYALRGVQIDIIAKDSIAKSYVYLQLSNAFIQTGFKEEALQYINKSLEYAPNNYYAPHLKAFILFVRDSNPEQTKDLLVKEFNKDTTRLDIMQDVAKMFYMQERYDSAFFYFQKFAKSREERGLDIYPIEDAKIAFVYKKMGNPVAAAKFFDKFSAFCDKDQSIYKNLNLAIKHAYLGETDQAIEHLKAFADTDNFVYWSLLIDQDPLFKPLKSHPAFTKIIQKIHDQFWANQARLKQSLERKQLL